MLPLPGHIAGVIYFPLHGSPTEWKQGQYLYIYISISILKISSGTHTIELDPKPEQKYHYLLESKNNINSLKTKIVTLSVDAI